jgi:hypothetical protein
LRELANAFRDKLPIVVYNNSVQGKVAERISVEELSRIKYDGGSDELAKLLNSEFEQLVAGGRLDPATFERITGYPYRKSGQGDETLLGEGNREPEGFRLEPGPTDLGVWDPHMPAAGRFACVLIMAADGPSTGFPYPQGPMHFQSAHLGCVLVAIFAPSVYKVIN